MMNQVLVHFNDRDGSTTNNSQQKPQTALFKANKSVFKLKIPLFYLVKCIIFVSYNCSHFGRINNVNSKTHLDWHIVNPFLLLFYFSKHRFSKIVRGLLSFQPFLAYSRLNYLS